MPTATPRSPTCHGAHLLVAGLLCAFSSLAAQSPDSPEPFASSRTAA
jgi:hypothetical protein